MRRVICLVLALAGTTVMSRACDVCGGTTGAQYLGILPQFYRQFVGLQYQYSSYSSQRPSLYEGKPDEQSTQRYNTFQLWGRYNAGKRVQLFAFVPYRYNSNNADGVKTFSSGIGDVSVLANVIVIKADSQERDLKQTLLAGGGIKTPTGKYAGITQLDKEGLPNMQAGTGAWDFVANANYTLRYGQAGVNLDATYTFTTANKESYKYGNRLATGLLAFYWLQKNDLILMPQAGLKYEYALHDYDNYPKKWLNEQSGGYQSFASVGFQFYYKQVGLQCMYNLPISQHYANGYVSAKQRLETGVFFLF